MPENDSLKGKTTLIITEKPQAAKKIASILSNSTDEEFKTKDGVTYYEFQRDNKNYIVGCAVGHLYSVQQNQARGPFPNYDISWQPASQKKTSSFTKKYLSNLNKLAKRASEFIVATDFDTEGEVIGWNVVRFVCGKDDAKRMKFSSLTKDVLEESFHNLLPTLSWSSAYAGETRHFIDWYYGINLSRGLMKALSSTGQFRILSIGRVQGPALKILADKEKEISNFQSTPYWQIFLQIRDIKNQRCEVKFPKDITNENELLRFQNLKGQKGIANTEIKNEEVTCPKPFDLTTLQTECYKFIGLTPAQTLKVAQSLYLSGLISYPRTSSQKYPEGIGYNKILNQLKKYTTLVKYAVNSKPSEGPKTDPAHPAIYPTGEMGKLSGTEKKVYDLIVKRFISCFCKAAIVENKKISVEVAGLNFGASAKQIKEKNWMAVYPVKLEEGELPTIEGDVDIDEIRIEEKMTKPPKRYSAASLVKELEKKNLGTKATRANIVETLVTRGYAKGKTLEVTELGMRIEETLDKYAPIILDEDLTREMTEELEKIESSESTWPELEKVVLEKAQEQVNKIAELMTKNLSKIGESLKDANEAVYAQEREENKMTKCPVCGEGHLAIRYGKRFGRYFVACDAYPKCKTTFSLPPNGVMKPARDKEGNSELCPECGFPMIASFKKGKAPWKFCFNPECPTNEDLQKKKEEFKEKLASGEIKIDENGKIISDTTNKTKSVRKVTKRKVSTKKKVVRKKKS